MNSSACDRLQAVAVVICCAPVFAVTATATMAVYMFVGLIAVPVEFIVCGTSYQYERVVFAPLHAVMQCIKPHVDVLRDMEKRPHY